MRNKLLSAFLAVTLALGMMAGALPAFASETYDVADHTVSETNVPLRLYYDEEASHGVAAGYDDTDTYFGSGASLIEAHPDDDWERWSIPIGNGYFGANLFGRTETERIQLTEKTLANPYRITKDSTYTDGLNNFSETYIDFGHTNSAVTNYSRELDLKTAISTVSYVYGGVTYTREYFTSYPDKAMVIRLDASSEGALDFVLRPTVPYEQEYMNSAGDGGGKTGTVTSTVENGVGKVVLSGTLEYFGIDFVGLYSVYTNGGTVTATTCTNADGDTDGTITVSDATSAYIVITMGTDYELTSETFTASASAKPTKTTTLADAMAKVEGYMSAVETQMGDKSFEVAYSHLKTRHTADYQNIFGRVSLDLDFNEADFELTTDQLLANYKNGSGSTYLEALYFQYGRYLLIASSRSGALPANLQGAWNRYNHSPWSSGYWHNVNVQMNYWPAFSTNIAETFEAYVEYNRAYMAKAMLGATGVVRSHNSAMLDKDGGNGWSIETGGYVNDINGSTSIGNLGFTTQLFWEYYDYTQDEEILRNVVYPVLVDAARFITKMVKEDADGNYIAVYSDSPEQYVDGVWYFTDKGTAYAQSFAYQNNYNLLLAAKDLGISTEDTTHEDYAILQTVLKQIDKYDPIRVGLSGQVKEFFEEEKYGDMGEYTHRHISQLVGLYPGNVINGTTPAWLDAARYTLTERGDKATGWGVAHRLNLWARIQDGERAYDLLNQLLKVNTATNLWDLHPPFQIDGNLGGTAGISEMLLQSHAGYIEPLAAIPEAWANGSYTGLVARGNFEVSAAWANGLATSFNIKSLKGGAASVKYSGITGATVCDSDGKAVSYTVSGKDLITFDTEAGKTYYVFGFVQNAEPKAISGLTIENEYLSTSTLTWEESTDATKYNVYVAKNSDSDYTLLGTTRATSYVYTPIENENARLTFAVTAVSDKGVESERSIIYRTPDVVTSRVEAVTANVVNEDLQVTIKSNEHSRRYKLFTKNNAGDAWSLLQESSYPIIIQPSYNADAIYGVSVVSSYGLESEIYEIDYISNSLDEIKYDPNNILLRVGTVPTEEGLAYVHSSPVYANYNKLIDGDFSTASGRFSTKQTVDDVLEFEAVLLGDFILGEMKIYDFQAAASSANYAGSHMKIDVFYDGVWKTVKEYNSNDEIAALRKVGTNYLSVDLTGVKARLIRIRIDTPPSGNSISLNEIECTGIAIQNGVRGYVNIFEKYEFKPTDDAASSGVWLPYSAITDGIEDTWGVGEGNMEGRFATSTGHHADGTMDFGGKVYTLHTLTVKYTGGAANGLCGKDLTIYVLRNDRWIEVVSEVYETGVAEITFDLGGIEAEKIRFYISAQRDAANYIGIAEMTCSGFKIANAEIPENNILCGTTLDQIKISGATLHSSVPDPTKAFDGDFSTRYAVNDKQNTYTLTVALDATYNLYALTFYPFANNGEAPRSNSTKVEVCNDGVWTTLAEGFAIPANNKVGYSVYLNGAKADAIRITFTNTASTQSTSLWELQCSGIEVETDALYKNNILTGYTFVAAEGVGVFKPYACLTDGKAYDSNGSVWEGTGAEPFRFASGAGTNKDYRADATVDFSGKVYKVYDFEVIYTGTQYTGVDFNIFVYRNGTWTQVVAHTYAAGVSTITFNLGGVEAEKIRFLVTTGSKRTDGSTEYVGIQEFFCSGYEVVEVIEESEDTNILLGTTADRLALEGNNVNPHPSVPNLTDAFDGNKTGTRYALLGSGAHSLVISLTAPHVLDTLVIYPFYEPAETNARSDNTTVDLYVDGTWIRVTQNSFVLERGETVVELGGIKAEKIRINFDNSSVDASKMTSIYEIECYGYLAPTEELTEDVKSNVLLNRTDNQLVLGNGSLHPGAGPLTDAFDGDETNTRFAIYGAPDYFTVEITLDKACPLYTMEFYPFHQGDTASRSNNTKIEVYTNGSWVTVVTGLEIAPSATPTTASLGGVIAEKIRVTFANKTGTTNATIYEMTCTTALPIAGDRTQLLEAYKALEATAAKNAAHAELQALKLAAMKEMLMDTSVDSDELVDNITEMTAQANSLQYGFPETGAYGDFATYNLSLSDDIGVNFYANFKDTAFTEFEDAVVVMELENGAVIKTLLSDLEQKDGKYALQIKLPAMQMTDMIKIRVIFDSNNCGKEYKTSIAEYAKIILNDSSYEAANPGINELVKSMLNYGTYAQLYFGYKTDKAENLANYGIYTDATNPVLNGDFSGAALEKPVKEGVDERIDAAGWTLAIDSDITVKFYFATSDITRYRFTLTKPSGEVLELDPILHQDGNVYRVEIGVEDAALIDDEYVLTITNVDDDATVTVTFSAMMYVNTTLAGYGAPSAELSNIVKAIKLYCDAANTYRNNGN